MHNTKTAPTMEMLWKAKSQSSKSERVIDSTHYIDLEFKTVSFDE